MDPGEMFRRFFGLPPRPRQPDSFHDSSTWRNRIPDRDDQGQGCCCDDDNDEDEISFFFGNSPNREEFHFRSGSNDAGLDGMFEHFGGGMFRQMEQLHKQMEAMMRGFGPAGFQPPEWGLPAPGGPGGRGLPPPPGEGGDDWGPPSIYGGGPSRFSPRTPDDPRDAMLKDGVDIKPAKPPSPPQYGADGKGPGDNYKDTDLDGKLSDSEILSLVKPGGVEERPPVPPAAPPAPALPLKPSGTPEAPRADSPRAAHPPEPLVPLMPSDAPRYGPGPSSFSSSMSTFSSVMGPLGGRVEQRRVVRDANGHEETTVSRSVNGQRHIVTTVRGSDGSQETTETFQNMDEKDKGSFDRLWNHPAALSAEAPPAAGPLAPRWPNPQVEPHDMDIFSRLFGNPRK